MKIFNIFLSFLGIEPKRLNTIVFYIISVISVYYFSLVSYQQQAYSAPSTSSEDIDRFLSEQNSEEEDSGIVWNVLEASFFKDNIIKLKLNLESKKDYSIFKEGLSFSIEPDIKPSKIIYPKSFERVDPISSKKKESFKEGNFEVYFIPILLDGDSLDVFIKYNACTMGKCLFPRRIQIPVKLSFLQTTSGININEDSSKQEDSTYNTGDIEIKEDMLEDTSVSYNPHVFLKKFISFESSNLLLFILIFLAGIFTNLTPCVAPMIPITVGILSKEKNKRASLFYGLGIMSTYLVLGMISSIGGKMFGFVMGSIWINILFFFLMLFLGITMLEGGTYFTRVQNFASLVIEKFSKIKRKDNQTSSSSLVFVKGSMAGLIAAPCTGPILATLITYIASSQKLIYGTSLMMFYSLGFSLPYVVLGSFSTKVMKIKIKTSILILVKIVFSGIIFGLSFYYLKNVFYDYLNINIWKYSIVISFLVAVGGYIGIRIGNKFNLFSNIVLSVVLGWGLFSVYQQINFVYKSDIEWVSTEKEAFIQSDMESKEIILDNWANWCESCLLIDKYFHENKDKLSDKILWKKDLSRETKENIEHRKKYNIKGLPTIIIIPKDKDMNNLKYIYDSYELDKYLKNSIQ